VGKDFKSSRIALESDIFTIKRNYFQVFLRNPDRNGQLGID
jgi:hypothetical protein